MFELSWTEVVTCVWVATVFASLGGYALGMVQGMASVRGPSLRAQAEYLADSKRKRLAQLAPNNAVTVKQRGWL